MRVRDISTATIEQVQARLAELSEEEKLLRARARELGASDLLSREGERRSARRSRARQMFDMREAGDTYKKIGAAFGIGASRAAAILQEYERSGAANTEANIGAETPIDALDLPNRLRCALEDMGAKTVSDLTADGIGRRLTKRPNVGKKSVDLLRLLLAKSGVRLG